MQTFIEASAVHKTARELVYDDNLVVLNNVVNVELHNAVRLNRLIDVVLKREVVGIGEVFDTEVFLCLFNTVLGEGSGLLLFVYNVINSVLGVVFLHILLGVELGKALELQGLCEAVSLFVQVGRFVALTRDNKRSSRLIYED